MSTDAKFPGAKDTDQKDGSISKDQWQSEFVTHLTKEIFVAIRREEKDLGEEFGDAAKFSMLASIVATVVYQSLSAELRSPARTQAADAEAHLRFQDIKEAVQNAVAAGFEGAVRSWGGGDEEFMCTIQIEPDAVNTEPC